MQPPSRKTLTLAAVLLLGLVSTAVAHGHDDDGDMTMDMGVADKSNPTVIPPSSGSSYFQYREQSGLMFAHILLMVIAWLFVLPLGVMLSISRSCHTLRVQFAFLVLNAVGVLLATMYNASTPDLYPNNAHHKLGWILTWIVGTQVAMGVVNTFTKSPSGKREDGAAFYTPVSIEAMAEHRCMQNLSIEETYRFSNDSGQGTEPNTESLRSQSVSSRSDNDRQLSDVDQECDADVNELEKEDLIRGSKVERFLSRKIPGLLSSRALRVIRLFYNVIDRLILILGFIALTTGFVTYGGLFMGPQVFSGLAHFIKGGVFLWYGILTLGRWAGCFADIGWAWNINPSKANRPSAEFVESFLIFLYGSTNIFLEHLAAWGDEWSAQDLEHLSVTVMFFGGGLCGMLIESKKIRGLLNAKIQHLPASHSHLPYDSEEEPKSYGFSMNPVPALIVLLLGTMMSSHYQESMVSTMIHKQWGMLLVGAAFARALTYVIFYLAPPTSTLPGRPPSEIITAFCLMAAGFIFMASSTDTIASMELHGLDAMFVFTVAMGLITFLMAWIVLVIAFKGWAVRKGNKYTGASGRMSA